MKGYVAKKIAYALLTLYIIATLNFVIFQVITPIDPTTMMVDPRWTVELKEALKKLWGLDQPLSVRYVKYIINMFTFNFGYSFMSKRPVIVEIIERLGNTLILLGSGLVATVILGIPLGVLAASKRGSKLDVLAIGFGLFTWGVPAFFIQLLFLLLFCNYLGWLPFGGMYPPGKPPEDTLTFIITTTRHLVLPVTTLVLAEFGSWALYARNMMLDILPQDFMLTARAKGLKEKSILFRHGLRAALPPILTLVALSIPPLFTGAIITEYVFTWPGIGYWFLTSMLKCDYPAVQALLFIYAVLMVGANFISDMLYGFLDPRIRIGARR